MSFHRNAKLGLAGRYALVSAIAEGMTLVAALEGSERGGAREPLVSV
jgi:hypothetical protein